MPDYTPSNFGTPVAVAESGSVVTLASAHPTRKGISIYNKSTNNLYISPAVGVTTSLFMHLIGPGGLYEFPFEYDGALHGIWDGSSHTGAALVTELK